MKTTPDGLTHLINMLVDVANLQRKALATPGACCEVELSLNHGSETLVEVEVKAVVNMAAPPPPVTLEQFGGIASPLSADNTQGPERMLSPSDIEAAADALETSGWRANGLDEVHGVTARQAAMLALAAVGLGHPGGEAVG